MFSLGGIRQIPATAPLLYLTFDDGPCPNVTPLLLDLLQSRNAKATFFVIGEKAHAHPEIIRRILAEGHAIGNHSWDHRYRYFFSSEMKLENWIVDSEKRLEDLIGRPSVGFRSPAGVRTPKLRNVLTRLKVPHILWSHRYFDAVRAFPVDKAVKDLRSAPNGSIVLLHDSQRPSHRESFLQAMDILLRKLQGSGKILKKIGLDLGYQV